MEETLKKTKVLAGGNVRDTNAFTPQQGNLTLNFYGNNNKHNLA